MDVTMINRSTILKALSKNVIDSCLMPGAAIGIEILWLYVLQWKNSFSLITLALISLVFSNLQISEHTSDSKPVNEQGNTR
jgi:hypothetical protein